MPLRWDPLLVRELARELDTALGGARLRALRLDGVARSASLLFREATLAWPLHPTQGAPRLLDATGPQAGDLPLAGRVRGVRAVEDERILVLGVVPARGRRQKVDIVVELLGNQWNLVVTEGREARIRHVLVRRDDRRTLLVGAAYEPPAAGLREGRTEPVTWERWCEILSAQDGDARARALVARVAWTSSINAGVFAGAGSADTGKGASEEDDRRAGYDLWRALAFGGEEPAPVLLQTPRGPQPYPWPLPGMPAIAKASLLEAFDAWVESSTAGEAAGEALLPPALLTDLEGALDRARRRVTSLEAELELVRDPVDLRITGDLLLARLADVPEGKAEVTLEDFEGRSVTVPLDPRLAPHENASALYEAAARAERARERLPRLLAEAKERVGSLEALAERVRSGEAGVEEVRAEIPDEGRAAGPSRGPGGPALPYRRYRSSGGLEIRVGRGAKHNDDLTFHHAAPDDVWLHARHAAGAHVVLRWGRKENPPARDLSEAAALAALNSRARTSSSVPVDWTFRKYVRKPRRSPPGQVLMERARTVFATPDPELAERLAEDVD